MQCVVDDCQIGCQKRQRIQHMLLALFYVPCSVRVDIGISYRTDNCVARNIPRLDTQYA